MLVLDAQRDHLTEKLERRQINLTEILYPGIWSQDCKCKMSLKCNCLKAIKIKKFHLLDIEVHNYKKNRA